MDHDGLRTGHDIGGGLPADPTGYAMADWSTPNERLSVARSPVCPAATAATGRISFVSICCRKGEGETSMESNQELRLHTGRILGALTSDKWEILDLAFGLDKYDEPTVELTARRVQTGLESVLARLFDTSKLENINVSISSKSEMIKKAQLQLAKFPQEGQIWRVRLVGKYGHLLGMGLWWACPPARVENESTFTRDTEIQFVFYDGNEGRINEWLMTLIENVSNGHASGYDEIFGDPATTVSVFALTGAFLGAILNRAAADAYDAMKKTIGRARRVRRTVPGGNSGEWVILHDHELNAVFECPVEIPAEAAVQVAQMRRSALRNSHFRWNSTLASWERIGYTCIRSRIPENTPDDE